MQRYRFFSFSLQKTGLLGNNWKVGKGIQKNIKFSQNPVTSVQTLLTFGVFSSLVFL